MLRRLWLLTGILLALAVSFSSLATASPRRTEIVRDGVYAGSGAHGTYVLFYVRHRRVYHLRFQITVACRDPSGPIGDRWFGAGSHMPQGRQVPRSGLLILNWHETGNGRAGEINAHLDFRRHRVASFVVIVPTGHETCDGLGALHIRRGPRVLPVPPGA